MFGLFDLAGQHATIVHRMRTSRHTPGLIESGLSLIHTRTHPDDALCHVFVSKHFHASADQTDHIERRQEYDQEGKEREQEGHQTWDFDEAVAYIYIYIYAVFFFGGGLIEIWSMALG